MITRSLSRYSSVLFLFVLCVSGITACDRKPAAKSVKPAYYAEERTMDFPSEFIQLREGVYTHFGSLSSREWEDPIQQPARWDDVGVAYGRITAREGQMICLQVYNDVPTIESLEHLDPNDIQTLAINNMSNLDPNELRHIDHLTGLRQLYVGGNKLTDESLRYLSGLNSLEHIDLQGCPVSDAGLQHLTTLTNLRSLWLFRTSVTNTGVAELTKQLPGCKISYKAN